MGKPGQLFTYKELKARDKKQGDALKKRVARTMAAAASKDISRVIIIIRKSKKAG